MKRFTDLYFEIDSTTRTNEKLAALQRYFEAAPPADAAWGLYFLSGGVVSRAVSTVLLRAWVAEEANLPLWLVEESYDTVGDLGEALALLLPETSSGMELPLHTLVEDRLIPLRAETDIAKKRTLLLATWAEMDTRQRLVWNKLITGSFRVGVARTLLERALAHVANVPQAIMAHRLMGAWEPTETGYLALLSGEATRDIGQPYPFYLAYPLDTELEELGSISDWQAEWKWDGIRAQLIRRGDQTMIWSRGDARVTHQVPEIAAVGEALPDGTVLDGEILAWRDEKPLPFASLQRRLGRKTAGPKVQAEFPIGFIVYDILEWEGQDIRSWPLSQRRVLLETVVAKLSDLAQVRVSPIIEADSWEALTRRRDDSREMRAEGLMLKRRDAAYGVGRQRGAWWKWKIEPYAVDAVMVYAQAGHGRRAGLYTDYTFAVWDNGELVPIAKAYSGLTDTEIKEVDRFVRMHTLQKHGPVRVIEPTQVFELAFEGLQESSRHKSGIAVRFPRIARQRKDKTAVEADTLETVKALLQAHVNG